MGGLRAIRKGLRPSMCDTHIKVNGCKVYVGHPDPAKAQMTADGFAEMFTVSVKRSRCPNMGDYYNAHFEVCNRLSKGETFKEIMS